MKYFIVRTPIPPIVDTFFSEDLHRPDAERPERGPFRKRRYGEVVKSPFEIIKSFGNFAETETHWR